jgi:hypothetical protein
VRGDDDGHRREARRDPFRGRSGLDREGHDRDADAADPRSCRSRSTCGGADPRSRRRSSRTRRTRARSMRA